MSEPTASTVAALTASGTIGTGVAILGLQTGLDYAVLLAGVAGGATALSYQVTQGNAIRQGLNVVTAALLAGYTCPLATRVVVQELGLAPVYLSTELQLGFAYAIGFLAHGVLLPGLKSFAEKFSRSKLA